MRISSFAAAALSPLALIAISVSVTACRGNVMASAKLQGAGTAEAHFTSNGAPVVLWADTDGKWRGSGTKSHFPAHYEIDIVSSGTKAAHVSCSTEDSSEAICGTEVTEGDMHSGDCELKLRCSVPALAVGDTVFQVTGTPGGEALEVKNMSINVRAK